MSNDASTSARLPIIDAWAQPAFPHLEDSDLVGGAEPVLQRAERPIGALALTLDRCRKSLPARVWSLQEQYMGNAQNMQ